MSNVRFELLFIGNELLIGKILNTNSQWLTRQITQLGGTCTRIIVVKDQLEEISSAVKDVLSRAPRFLIISGGLGPTYDDMTLEGLARALKKPLKVDETALSLVNARYKELLRKGWITKLEMTPSRTKMAKLPLTSKPLHNPIGTAPGVLIREGNTKIICLPGVPKELEAIFKNSVKKEILKEIGVRCFLESNFIVKGIGESAMASTIEEVMERYSPYVYIKSHPKHRARASDVTVEFNLTTTYDLKNHKKGRVFLKRKIKEAQQDLEKGVKKLGGKIEH